MKPITCCAALGIIFAPGCPGLSRPARTVTLTFDFNDGFQGWVADVSDYSTAQADIIDFDSRIRDLPEEVGSGLGYFVTSSNRSDDLFVFLKRQLGQAEGLVPNRPYRLTFSVQFASNAQIGCAGVGGSPGESVYLMVGASTVEPVPLSPDESGYIALNIDKSNQSNDGANAIVIGDIANGDECADPTSAPYKSVTRASAVGLFASTDENAKLWLLVGIDSAFEGITNLYYQSITVTVAPAYY